MGNIELKTYAGANVTPQNDAIMNDANTMNNGIYYGCNVTIKDATTLHITAGQGIIYGRVFEVVDSDISVSLSSSGTLLGQLFVRLDLGNISSPAEILVDTGASLTPLVDDDQINIDAGITEMQLATFKVNTITLSDLAETFASVQPIRAVIGDADISAIGDGSVKGAIRTINMHLSEKQPKTLSHAIAGQTTVEGCLSQLASQQSNAWVDITDLCSYNGGITYLHKIAKYCNGVLRVTLSMAPTNFITGAAVLSLPANFRFNEVFYCSGVCVNGSGEPVQSNAFVAENAHGAAGNTTIIVQKSNGAADYVAFTIMIPVSKLY